MRFGDNLRNLRVMRHMSQQKLADEMDISQSSVAAYETGEREPSFAIIQKFADYFGVSASMLTPFVNAPDEYVQSVADTLHQNQKLQKLFDMEKSLPEQKLDVLISVVSAISGEQEGSK